MPNNNCPIDNQIRRLKNAIKSEQELYCQHLHNVNTLSSDLHFLLQLRKSFFPEQYTKYGNLRKKYKDLF